jgi:hypothetical protein
MANKTLLSGKRGKDWASCFEWRVPVLLALIVYVVIFALLKIYAPNTGVVEPIPITVAWTLDDFLGIVITFLTIWAAILVVRFVSSVVVDPEELDVTSNDRMGSWSSIGEVTALNAAMVGITNSIWLLPWFVTYLGSPILAQIPSGSYFQEIAIGMTLLGSLLLPVILFGYAAHKFSLALRKAKASNAHRLKQQYARLHGRILSSLEKPEVRLSGKHPAMAAYLLSSIDRVEHLKEWPVDTKNLILVSLSIGLQLIQIILKIAVK